MKRKYFLTMAFFLMAVFLFAQTATAQTQYQVSGLKLTCTETGEGGEDEVYLEVSIDGGTAKRYPDNSGYYSMNEESSIAIWNIPYTFVYTSSCKITVKESDDFDDDLIGEVTIYSSGGSKDMNDQGAKYKLDYKVITVQAGTATGKPFKFIFNGIRCMQTTDDGEDELYLMVEVDGGQAVKVENYSMNERASGWLEIGWDDMVEAAKKEYWLLPGSWNVQNKITITIWEDDGSPNPDDNIGSITVYNTDADGYNHWREFTTEGHYFASFTKETLRQRPSNVPARLTLMNPDIGTRTDAVADQGGEGACASFSTTSAIASKVINYIINKNADPVATRAKLSALTKPMFDASWFFSLRDAKSDGTKGDGWYIQMALEKAKTITLPFVNGNKNYGIRLKDSYSIKSDGLNKMSVTFLPDIGGITTTYTSVQQLAAGQTRQDMMREYLQKKEVLLAGFSVYEDFHAYVRSKKVYGGTIYQSGTANDGTTTGHAVMVTGFVYPDATDNGPAYWEVQNSWGKKWGNNGFCKFVPNACGLDNEMYFPGDFYVCDLQGNKVSDEEADRLIWEALNGALGTTPPTPADLGSLGDKFVFVENLWKPNMRINIETQLTASARLDGDWSAHWKFVKVPGTECYFIENRWKKGRLHIENGVLEFGTIQDGAWSAQWKLRQLTNGAYLIDNRWKPEEKIHIENGKLECSKMHDGANSAMWYLKAL